MLYVMVLLTFLHKVLYVLCIYLLERRHYCECVPFRYWYTCGWYYFSYRYPENLWCAVKTVFFFLLLCCRICWYFVGVRKWKFSKINSFNIIVFFLNAAVEKKNEKRKKWTVKFQWMLDEKKIRCSRLNDLKRLKRKKFNCSWARRYKRIRFSVKRKTIMWLLLELQEPRNQPTPPLNNKK